MITIIDCGSSKTPLIAEIIDEHCDCQIIPLLDFNLSECIDSSGFIISGAPILLTEKDTTPYLESFEWLKTTEIPVLGICFGHQMMGLSFGALINRQREDRDWQTIEILAECPLFNKLPHEIELMEDHCESISIPSHFIHVAVSDSCINEAMMHETRQLYGVQFHPEVSGLHGAIVLENFVHICEERIRKNSN